MVMKPFHAYFNRKASRIEIYIRAAVYVILVLTTWSSFCDAQLNRSPSEERVEKLLQQLTLEEKLKLVGGVDLFYTPAVSRLGIPRIKMSDGPFGARNDGPATTFAAGIGLGATWDRQLAMNVGVQIGRDARARGVHYMLAPGVNMTLAPINGRNFEYLGEDPYLSGSLAVGYIRGLQSQGVSAMVKHYAANNSEFDRHNIDSHVDERALREIYLPAFEMAVKKGEVGALMDSYNLIDGEHATQNGMLNNQIAKKEWGLQGPIVSDWLSTYDGVAAANNGLDLEMPFGIFMNPKVLAAAIQSGKIDQATIDDKVRRLLRNEVRFGWLERPQLDPSVSRFNEAGREVALLSATEAMVLLKNEGHLLPLNPAAGLRIALIGPDAYPAIPVAGGSAEVKPYDAVSFLDGISRKFGAKGTVLYDRGIPSLKDLAKKTHFTTTAAGKVRGLIMETYKDSSLTGTPMASTVVSNLNQEPTTTNDAISDMDFSDPAAVLQKIESIRVNCRWTGYYNAEKPGVYGIFTEAIGEQVQFRLLLDDRIVIDDWKLRSSAAPQLRLSLSQGVHKIVFEYVSQGLNIGNVIRVGVAPMDSIVSEMAKKLASRADLVLLSVGYDSELEGEGADRTFELPLGQDELIEQIEAINSKAIVLLTSGGNVDMNRWIDKTPVLLETWYAGQEAGTAVADLLSGSANPSGRLPVSFEKRWEDNPVHDSYYPIGDSHRVDYQAGVFVGYRGYQKNGVAPRFPFGFGLSYTSFVYKDLKIAPEGNGYKVSVTAKNTGGAAGADVIQLYVGEQNSKLPRPKRELKGFDRVELLPGESKRISFALDARSFQAFDVEQHQWLAAADDYSIEVGNSAENITLRGSVRLTQTLTSKP